MKKTISIDIKFSAIFKILLTIALVWAVLKLSSLVIAIFISFIIATAIRPAVKKLQKYKIPKGISISVIYFILIAIVATLIYLVARPLTAEIISFSKRIPEIIHAAQQTFPILAEFNASDLSHSFSSTLKSLGENAGAYFGPAVNFIGGAFDIFTSILTIFFLSLYLTLGLEKIIEALIKFIPHANREQVMKHYNKIEEQIGAWVRGQLALMVLIGLVTYVLLLILGIPFAGPLAIFAGLMEILPIIGPLVYSVVIIFVALLVSPFHAAMAAAGCLVIQQAEGSVIVPLIMKKAIGISPITTIIAILAGGTLLGVIGALLAVPVVAVISALVQDLYAKD